MLRLEQLVLEELQAVFSDEIDDPRLAGVRPLAATFSPDYRHIRVHCLREGEGASRDDVERALQGANGFLRRRLLDLLELKRIPELHMILDT